MDNTERPRRYRSRVTRVDRICAHCGQGFQLREREAARNTGAYCSRGCYHGQQAARHAAAKQAPPATRRCLRCGEEKALEEFKKRADGLYGRTATCKRCEGVPRAAGRPSIEKRCPTCGLPFFVYPSGEKRIHCSMACRRAQPTRQLAPNDAAYIAGLFDGEGCVSVVVNRRVVRQFGYSMRHQLSVQISNTHQGVVDWVCATYGGKVKSYQPGRGRIIYKWFLNDRHAATFLRDLLPYLIVKREQAEVGLAFRVHVEEGGPGQGRRLTPEELAVREDFRLRLRALKGEFAPRSAAEAYVDTLASAD
jgi:hypothetical protein